MKQNSNLKGISCLVKIARYSLKSITKADPEVTLKPFNLILQYKLIILPYLKSRDIFYAVF